MKTLFQRYSAALVFLFVFSLSISAQTPTLTNDDVIDRRIESPPTKSPLTPTSEKLVSNSKETPNLFPLKSGSVEAIKSAGGSGRELITNTLTAFEKITSFRASVQLKGIAQDNRNYTAEIEYIKPDRVHIRMDELEAITIGTVSYVKMKGQGWKRTERANVGGNDVKIDPTEMKKFFDLIFSQIKVNAQILSEETIDGVATNLYQFKIEMANSKMAGAQGASDLGFRAWIGRQDQLLRKLTFSSPDNKFQLAVRLYDFNEPLHITSPIN